MSDLVPPAVVILYKSVSLLSASMMNATYCASLSLQNLDVAQQRVRSHAVSSIPGLGPSGGGPGGMAAAGGPRPAGGGAPGARMDEEDVE